METTTKYEIVDCFFNHTWYANLIGKVVDQPPPYCVCKEVRVEMTTPEDTERLEILSKSTNGGY